MEQSGNRSAGRDLVALRAEDMVRPARSKRDGQKKGENSYAAQPLGKRAPEEYAPGQLIQPRKHGDARGRKAAHRFKVGIEVV